MLCHTSLFIFSLCTHAAFYKTLTPVSTVFIKGRVGFLQLLKWQCRTSFFLPMWSPSSRACDLPLTSDFEDVPTYSLFKLMKLMNVQNLNISRVKWNGALVIVTNYCNGFKNYILIWQTMHAA